MTRKEKFGVATLSISAFLAALFGGIVYGLPPIEGQDPVDPIRGKFDPKEFNVVLLEFGGPKSNAPLTVKHAFFEVPQGQNRYEGIKKNGVDDVECAIALLKGPKESYDEQLEGTPDGGDCKIIKREYKKPKDPKRPNGEKISCEFSISKDFDCLDYFSQTRIYVHIVNEDVSFNELTPVSFTAYGAFDKPGRWPWQRTKDKNRSFGSAKGIPYGQKKQKILYLENHYRNSWGSKIPDGHGKPDKAEHSINFNLIACRGDGEEEKPCVFGNPDDVFPIIVDPDTGNGNDG